MLSPEQAFAAIRGAARWGYSSISISGGEPLLYPWLRECLELASDLGMSTAVVTNGWLIDRQEAIDTLRQAGTVAVSVDGLTDTHDAMRGSRRAFSRVMGGMRRLAESGIPFAVSCGVTNDNVVELDDLAQQVFSLGAKALQLHPIERSGRATNFTPGTFLQPHNATAFFILALALACEYAGKMTIQLDVVHREVAKAHPRILYAEDDDPSTWNERLPAELIGVLVLDPAGRFSPISYGFSPAYEVGRLAKDDLDQIWPRYLDKRYPALRQLGRRVHEFVSSGRGVDVFNPSDLLSRASFLPNVQALERCS